MALSREEVEEQLKELRMSLFEETVELRNRHKFRHIDFLFPDDGPFRRELYQKTIDWFNAGFEFQECVLFGGNRVGKTEAGAYQTTMHATGNYPSWWEGRRFESPTSGVVAGRDGKTVRDTVQQKLIGFPERELGTGMIPLDQLVLHRCKKAGGGTPNLYDTLVVRHKTGGDSIINLKSYEQGRVSFEGTRRHYVWEDEEASMGVHRENLRSVFDHSGVVFNTYTPLKGQTPLTRDLRERASCEDPSVYMETLTWDGVPHISDEQIANYKKRWPAHEMKARRYGLPKMGTGSIFTTDFEDEMLVKPFELPQHWPRAYGMDFGWSPHPTAVVWGAWDRENDIVYLYSEHRMKRELPSAHADAIKARGKWIKGNSETAGTNADDGKRMITIYRDLGLHLIKAKKDVEAGIWEIRQRVETGRLLVFSNMVKWREEYEGYHRVEMPNEGSKIYKNFDDLMDATRYLLSRMNTFRTKPMKRRTSMVSAPRFGDYQI